VKDFFHQCRFMVLSHHREVMSEHTDRG
jgi:hypothetical protein